MATAEEISLARYRWASDFINGLIQGPPSPPPDATAGEIRARAIARVDRLRRFLAFLGNPQSRFRAIHVGGTCGKGSTSAYIASILTSAGYRTGLHVSPYIQVETEKLQIDRRLMPADDFATHVADLAAEVERWNAQGGERVTYGEFWVALTFFALMQEAVDFAVIEVGAGGRFDLTNVLEPDIAVITSVGIDHVRTLGHTIPEIAWHKAGIIKPGGIAVTTVNDPAALEVITREATEQQARLIHLVEGRDYRLGGTGETGTWLVDLPSERVFHLPLPGAFQAANAAAAIGAVRALPNLSAGPVPDEVIDAGLAATRFPGRMEIVQDCPQVVLDGAHSPEKMANLMASIPSLGDPERRILVLGALSGHDYRSMAEIAARRAHEVIVTAPKAVERASAPAEEIADIVRGIGLPVTIVIDPEEALSLALRRAGCNDQILVTGSLYLVGAAREHWYRSDDIVRTGTCWPSSG
ncbi:bifunctional folylpolyglutamate synthase/dihydrofolate synthase [Nitrolancea hollandica]|uniref:Dihydrofolate synthase/folylpolyglutamate synthase n=1 Tax=Nitrolancea hollandica Lb TaxID=1129897 RepID=I4ECY4_9BACT|nr:Mur ligase family protein [Nitrolancea hollandica]CCF82546.1 FolC bifunctional protein [Nitrolancea hollandica Lb]